MAPLRNLQEFALACAYAADAAAELSADPVDAKIGPRTLIRPATGRIVQEVRAFHMK